MDVLGLTKTIYVLLINNVIGEKMEKNKCPNPIGRVLRHGIFHNVSCKSWKCLHCSKVKKLKLMRRFEHNKGSFRYRMLTLTEWKHPDNYENAKQLTQHWNRLKSSLRKKTKTFEGYVLKDYLWTKEYKPLEKDKNYWVEIVAKRYNAMSLNDAIKYIMANYKREKSYYDRDYPDKTTSQDELFYPHMHVAVPAYIDVNRIRQLWELATNHTADQVHIPKDEDMVIKNPIAYMTKYIMKSDMMDGFSPHERRYGCSRNYPSKEQPFEADYIINDETIHVNYIPYKDKDPNMWFILNKGNKIKDEIYIRNELRIGSQYSDAKSYRKKLTKIYMVLFGNLRNLNVNGQKYFEFICSELEMIEKYLALQ